MARIEVAAERTIDAPPEVVYSYIANLEHHRQFLPPAFSDFAIESGGVGAGSVVSFKVTAASSTAKPSKFVVSGLAVNDYSTTATLMPLVTGWYSSTATCASGPASTRDPTDNVAVAFTTGRPLVTQIYGATADATAVAELEHVYGPVHGCPTTLSGHHSVILARDTFYSDALASQYLASFYRTGTLLTHPTSLPTLTKQAIEFEGITTVYVVGGPLAVSTTVAAQVQTIPVFKCGGKNLTTTVTGAERFVHVVRVTGPTEYATAKAIAERVPKTTVGMLKAQDAYATAKNFNDTTGTESKTPSKSGSLTTAIVATGQGFQDAMSASALSYSTHLPILLTTAGSLSSQAKAAIEDLNIQQVVLMGGPLAVSNAVVTQLEAITVTGGALHVSVLRIAGKTFTDTAVQLAKFELGTTNGGIDWDQAKGANVCHAYTFTNMTALFARATLPNDFTDGLAGAVLESCGTTGKTAHLPLLEILNPSSVGTVLTAYLKMAGVGGTGVTSGTTEKIKFPIILGGPLAVAPSTIAAIQTDLQH
jgi:putative cell wall-binding protein